MHFGIWQIVIIGIYVLNVGINLAKHGEPRTDKYNFFGALFGTAVAITFLALGGFFSK